MSTFNNALSSIWTATGSVINIATGSADIANAWITKHRVIQKHTAMAEIEAAISTKSVEIDQQLQRNAEMRNGINQSLVDAERQRISAILTSL